MRIDAALRPAFAKRYDDNLVDANAFQNAVRSDIGVTRSVQPAVQLPHLPTQPIVEGKGTDAVLRLRLLLEMAFFYENADAQALHELEGDVVPLVALGDLVVRVDSQHQRAIRMVGVIHVPAP